jgi:hypothetical protein
MAKASKPKKETKKRPDKYEKPLQVNGTFMDIINAAVKHTKNNTPKKKKV